MPVTSQELQDELNLVTDYASSCGSLVGAVGYSVTDAESDNCSTVTVSRYGNKAKYLVDRSWCNGNLKRLPDRCSMDQILTVLRESHPDVMGVGPKHPEAP